MYALLKEEAVSGFRLLKELDRYNIGTFADLIYRNALLHPDDEAYVYGDTRVTFSQYNTRVNKLVNYLQKIGIKKGETIGIIALNCMQFADFNGAAMKGGFIGSPFNTRLTASELEYIINYSETRILFLGPEFIDIINTLRPALTKVEQYVIVEGVTVGMTSLDEIYTSSTDAEPDVDIQETDPMYIIYTSGTTGVPRGALYDHAALMDDARTFALYHGLQPGDKHLQAAIPMFHIAGNEWFRMFMLLGLCNVIQKTFDPLAIVKTIQEEKITHMVVVPTHVLAILKTPGAEKYDIGSMKVWNYGGSPMPLEALKKALNSGFRLGEGYGQSESGPAITHLSREDHEALDKPEEAQKILISTGRPEIGVHVRIVDDQQKDVEPGEIGEIIVKSKHVMIRYWKKPEDTTKTLVNGWLHTGDMGYYDEKGYIYIADRKKDTIISGGENVYPREIEEILYKHPAVSEAAVIGIPHPYWVETVHAVISLKKGSNVTGEEIIAFCRKYIAGYKIPKSVAFRESLPKNALGKILKKELRQQHWPEQTKEK
jgi:long-chain acyl-CoA synthetase